MADRIDDKADNERGDGIYDKVSPQRNCSARNLGPSKCHQLCLCHVAITLLILSILCCCHPIYGQELELKYRLEEEQSASTYVGSVVEDANLGKIYNTSTLQQLQFRFLRQQHLFVIDNMTGIIRTNSQIDREAICPSAVSCDYRIDVVVQPQLYFRIIRAMATILDINDNSPQFDRDEQVVEISESASVGTILLVPSAVDQDSPAFSIQSYRILSSSNVFELVASGKRSDGTSDVKLMLARPLDREQVDNYRLQIVAVDGGYPQHSGSMDVIIHVLDVNDNSPVFEKENYTVTVMENIPKHVTIMQVRAHDADIGLNGEVVYTLSLPSMAAYGNLFGIDNGSGDIYIKGDLDFEENSAYYLTVVARDRGPDSTPVSASVVVLVSDANDNAPDITIDTLSESPGVAEVAEDSLVGTFIAHLTVIDRDDGNNGRFECHLNDSHFQIIEVYGTEYQIVTAAPLDHEDQPLYSLALSCMDFGDVPQESVKYLQVVITDVNDNDPVFGQSLYKAELIENNYVGAILMTVNATDRDSGKFGEIVYSLSGEAASSFNIDPKTGLVTAAVSLDREMAEVIRFHVVARDQGVPARSGSALAHVTILDVNDEKPSFSHSAYSFAVKENMPPDTEVGTVAADDRDSSVYGEVTYALVPTDGSDLFDIDHKSGSIITMKTLDRELLSTYYLTVVASDRGIPPLSSTASVTVYVADENDNAPVFEFPAKSNITIYVSNQTPKGHVIMRLKAHDLDVGPNGKIVFDVTEESKTEMFDLDMELGTVLVKGDLSELDGRQYLLEFIARDEGLPSKMAFTLMNIVVNRSTAFLSMEKNGNAVGKNLLIILLLVIISSIIIIVLVIAIVMICRRDKKKQTHRYNCRAETLKMKIYSKGVKPSISECSDFSGAAEPGSSPDDRGKKELSLSMDDHGLDLCDEKSPHSPWPSSFDPHTIQNPHAASSLLDNSGSSAARSCLNGTPPCQLTNTSKFPRNDYHSSQTIPLLQHSKEVEVNRLLKALNDNDADSIHSGEGSNTDSGHGPSEEGESNAHLIRPLVVSDRPNNLMQVAFARTPIVNRSVNGQPFNSPILLGNCCNNSYRVVSDTEMGNSFPSSHSYSSRSPVQQLHTFGPRYVCHPGLSVCIGTSPDEDGRTGVLGSTISTPTSGQMKSPRMFTFLPHSARSKYSSLDQQDNQVSSKSPGGNLGKQLHHRNTTNFNMSHDDSEVSRQRLLNNSLYSDSDSFGVPGQYSCGDVSVALRQICSPIAEGNEISNNVTVSRDDDTTITSGSYVIDPYDLCDQIDDLFFRDKMPITSCSRPPR